MQQAAWWLPSKCPLRASGLRLKSDSLQALSPFISSSLPGTKHPLSCVANNAYVVYKHQHVSLSTLLLFNSIHCTTAPSTHTTNMATLRAPTARPDEENAAPKLKGVKAEAAAGDSRRR